MSAPLLGKCYGNNSEVRCCIGLALEGVAPTLANWHKNLLDWVIEGCQLHGSLRFAAGFRKIKELVDDKAMWSITTIIMSLL